MKSKVSILRYEVNMMEVSYKKLWKFLIDKDMKKKDLQAAAHISWASVTKLSKGETVSMEVLMKVCKALECNIGDIMDLIPTDEDGDV
jgi:Predicted transcriptional regulator